MRTKHIIGFILASALTFLVACPRLAPKAGLRLDTRSEDIQGYMAFELNPSRDGWQKPLRVIDDLDIEPGDVVADVGAGVGYFTWRLSEAVGDGGRVYVTESQVDLLTLLIKKSTEGGYGNVKVVEAMPHDPKLPYKSLDLALVCSNLERIDHVYTFFDMLRRSLKPDGKLAVIDWKKGADLGPEKKKRRSADEVEVILEGLGFILLKQYDFLEHQYFMVFVLKERYE